MKRLILPVKIFLILIITIQIFSRLINSRIDYDEGYNLQESINFHKNFQLRTYDLLFDPHVTTGPTVLLPSSLFINNYLPQLPRLVVVLYSFLLIYLSLKFFYKTDLEKILFLVIINFVPLFYFFSSHVLGEIPAFTLLLISFIFYPSENIFGVEYFIP